MAEDIKAYPLQGYSTLTVKGRGVLVKLQLIALDPQTGQEVLQDFPLQLSSLQARALAESLVAAAEAADMGQSPSTTRN